MVTAYMPDVTVDIAFDSGYLTAATARTWTDVTDYVEAEDLIQIGRGRPNEHDQVQPSSLSVRLDNKDGRFTPEYVTGAYYPNIKKGRPIRVRARWPLGQAGNLCTANQASVETSAVDWATNTFFGTYTAATSVAQSAAQFFDGTKSVLATWPLTAIGSWVGTVVTGLVIGRTYIASVYVYVPAGSPDPRIELLGPTVSSARTSTKAAWTRLSVSFTATVRDTFVGVQVASASAGQQCYIDALMVDEGSTLGTFTTAAPPIVDRYLGYVDEWPVVWPDGSASYSTVTVSAMSRQARLGRNAAFKSIVEEEILYDTPTLYYPLGEPAGALEAGNIAAGRSERMVVTQAGANGTLTFGAATGPGTDDLTAPVLTPVDSVNGKYLKAVFSTPLPSNAVVAVELWVSCPAALVYNQYLFAVEDATNGNTALFAFINSTTGTVSMGGNTGAGLLTSAASVVGGNVHHVACKFSWSAGTLTTTLIVDGVVTTTTGAMPTPVNYHHLTVGSEVGGIGNTTNNLLVGSVSHVALYSSTLPADARFQQHYNVGADSYAEASGARVARYARLAGIPTAEVSTETGLSTSIAHADTTGQSPVEVMQRVTVTEDGVVFDGRDGTLTFHSRSHRYGAAAAFTLSCLTGEVEANFSPVLDDQGVTNDMTASRANGAEARSVNQASINEVGYYRDTVELVTTSDNDVQARADWEVNRFGTPRVKVTSVSVNVTVSSSAQVALLLAADIGTRFTITNLPSQAPASTMDFFIEGITEEIGGTSYRITFNTSAAAYANVWILESATLSQLDSTTLLAY